MRIICFFELLQYHQTLIVKVDRTVYIPPSSQRLDLHNPSSSNNNYISQHVRAANPADYVRHSIRHYPTLFLQSVSTILKLYLLVEDRKVSVDCHVSERQQFFLVHFVIAYNIFHPYLDNLQVMFDY